MDVHSLTYGALVLAMESETKAGVLPFELGDAEWVANLFETLRAGDLDSLVGRLEETLGLMRRAANARQTLTTVEPALLREGLMLAAGRREGAV